MRGIVQILTKKRHAMGWSESYPRDYKPENTKKYYCSICKYGFKNQISCKRHELMHDFDTMNKSYKEDLKNAKSGEPQRMCSVF
jgi:hypothetical protein